MILLKVMVIALALIPVLFGLRFLWIARRKWLRRQRPQITLKP